MRHTYRWLILLAATATSLMLINRSMAVAPEIRDEGKFFSAAALKSADERIREIYRKHGRDVLIETHATVPTADQEKVKGMDAAQRKGYFSQWAMNRTKARVVNGVYVLICKDPQYLYVDIHEKEPPFKFGPDSWKLVEEALRLEFKATRFDEGLDKALKVVEDRLALAKK